MSKERLGYLRMADALWARYCRAGLLVAIGRHAAGTEPHARMRTAWHSYQQFCKAHEIQP